MNARQRRRDRRLWRYSVVVSIDNYEQYIEMWKWLQTQHGIKATRCGWRDRVKVGTVDDPFELLEITWQFVREQDASNFTLRWL